MATTEIGSVSNDGATVIDSQMPYRATVTIKGVCTLIFHRLSVDGVEAKAKAGKGS
jgi:hypothetical protein